MIQFAGDECHWECIINTWNCSLGNKANQSEILKFICRLEELWVDILPPRHPTPTWQVLRAEDINAQVAVFRWHKHRYN